MPNIGEKKVLLFIPAYNCCRQLRRLLENLPPKLPSAVSEVLIVENRSDDDTLSTAQVFIENASGLRCNVRLFQNERNYGLGGSHKIAYRYACEGGFGAVVTLHGDDQADLSDFGRVIDEWSRGLLPVDAILGSRFTRGASMRGYAIHRHFGNVILNVLLSLIVWKRVLDIGSGLNMLSTKILRRIDLTVLPDSLSFNSQQLLELFRLGARIEYRPISWREVDQRSNAVPWRIFLDALKQALKYRCGFEPERVPLEYSTHEIVKHEGV